MSLDIDLYYEKRPSTGIFVRENGSTLELSIEEVKDKFPDYEDKYPEPVYVFGTNITHNLTTMADKAGIYKACWRPEEIGATKAKHIIKILEKGYEMMINAPGYFKQFDSENGWGTYEHFLPWVKEYIEACKEHPEARIYVSR